MRKIILFLLVTFFFSCDEEVLYDKEVRLPFSFPFNGMGGFSTETSILTGNMFLRNFNKKNYPELKSITFSAFIQGSDPVEMIVELYNETDGVIVQKSLISTTSTEHLWVDSENILNSLPNKEIDLTMAIHLSSNDGSGEILGAELILKRD